MQDFLPKELLLSIVKTLEQSAQYALLEMLDVVSLCVRVELSVAPIITTWTSSRPPSKVSNSRTSSDTPIPCWDRRLIYHLYCTACSA